MSTPSARAASATACVAMCGSTWPSPGIQTAPRIGAPPASGSRSSTSAGEISSASSPMPAAALAARRRSSRLSSLDAMRTLPTSAKTPSWRYSSTL
jgi:hypothetical protein